MHNRQKEVLKENIISPIIGTLFENNIPKLTALQLLEKAKQERLGSAGLITILGKYDVEILDALDGISRLYENPRQILINTYQKATPHASEIKAAADEIIKELINTYYLEENNNIHTETMEKIRKKVIEFNSLGMKEFDRLAEVAKEIMQLKENAHIPNTGEIDYFSRLNLSNLDLSNIDFRNRDYKLMSFKNCNLKNSAFDLVSRCYFDNANLENADFSNANCRGENRLNFKNANVKNACFLNAKIEKGSTWKECQTNEEVRQELKERGALNTDQIVFSAPSARVYSNEEKLQNVNNQSVLRREWENRSISQKSPHNKLHHVSTRKQKENKEVQRNNRGCCSIV